MDEAMTLTRSDIDLGGRALHGLVPKALAQTMAQPSP